jgi:hypothetical protein
MVMTLEEIKVKIIFFLENQIFYWFILLIACRR